MSEVRLSKEAKDRLKACGVSSKNIKLYEKAQAEAERVQREMELKAAVPKDMILTPEKAKGMTIKELFSEMGRITKRTAQVVKQIDSAAKIPDSLGEKP